MEKKIIGRSIDCEYVIFDPDNRVSRRHAEVSKRENKYYVKDLGSLNGTYVNGQKLIPNTVTELKQTDRLTLSTTYLLDFQSIFTSDLEETRIVDCSNNEETIIIQEQKAIYRNEEQTVVFDRDKTQIAEISQIDKTKYITIGRGDKNDYVVKNNKVSKEHCKIRLLTPMIIEIIDLGSTNGTFADGIKLNPYDHYHYSSAVKLSLSRTYPLKLKEIFPSIQIVNKSPGEKRISKPNTDKNNFNPTEKELKEFYNLELVWKEYIERQNQTNTTTMKYSLGGAFAGLVAAVLFSSLTQGAGILLAGGGGLVGRFLGQQKSNELRNDLSYEEMFLETYACPRCKESFQKKPWITIRECYKCKTKFR